MEATLLCAGIFILFVGYIAARIEFNQKLKTVKVKHYWLGFEDGVDNAFKDLDAVRNAYNYHFANRP